jgi:diaminopropionate ammonia-lyase
MTSSPHFLVNDARSGEGWASSSDALASRPIDVHRRLPGYEPTPLHRLDAVAEELGLSAVWVKDESIRLGLPAFKMLGASWACYRSLVDRLGHEPQWSTVDELAAALEPLKPLRLCTATDGNHGRAVARTARLLGLDARIFVPAGTADARIRAIEEEGAPVGVVDGTYDDAVAHAAEVAAADVDGRTLVVSDTSWEGYERVPRWVVEGYTTIFAEIDEAVARSGGAPPDVVVIQIGVGALAAAAAARYGDDARDGRVHLLGVEPTTADCMLASVAAGHPVEVPGPHRSIMAGLNCGAPSMLAFPAVDGTFSAFVAIDDDRARDAMCELDRYGIEAGETGGAGLAGLRYVLSEAPAVAEALGLGPTTSVLLICTEGATDPDAYARIVGHRPTSAPD